MSNLILACLFVFRAVLAMLSVNGPRMLSGVVVSSVCCFTVCLVRVKLVH